MINHFEDVIRIWLDTNHLRARDEDIKALAETLAFTARHYNKKSHLFKQD